MYSTHAVRNQFVHYCQIICSTKSKNPEFCDILFTALSAFVLRKRGICLRVDRDCDSCTVGAILLIYVNSVGEAQDESMLRVHVWQELAGAA